MNTETEGNGTMQNLLTRRAFTRTAGAFAAFSSKLFAAEQQTPSVAYVGTYSSPQGPEGSKGRGQGIYIFDVDSSTGAFKQRELIHNDSNPSWLAFHPSRKYLYSANETQVFEGKPSGSVSAYAVDKQNGHLTLLNTISSEGAGPAHLSVHPSGKYVLVANYYGGTVAVLPIEANGTLRTATDVKQDKGKLGSQPAASAPPGSFAISGHDRTHAHMILSDPAGRYVISTDLGTDQILLWRFDVQKGTLTPNNPAFVQLPSGDGPRHFAFHPTGEWMYSLQEESSTVIAFDYDAAHGTIKAKQTVSSLPKGFAGTDFTSEIVISKNGKFLYAANRLHDTIAYFSINEAGRLTYKGEEWTRGDYPRSFTIDPTGRFLYSCNQRSDAITVFRINKETGALSFTGQYFPLGTPAMILFLRE
jgi:6-phosphogluconolactonase